MSDHWLQEQFNNPKFDPRLKWFNEPPRWSIDPTRPGLTVETAANTDFWQRTHYGFQADNGHCLLATIPPSADFLMSTHVRFHPVHQYDQAGLIVRLSADCWLKTSVEYEPEGPSRLGAVVTNAGYSDWSTQDMPPDLRDISLRIQRVRADYTVEANIAGTWSQLRVAHLMEDLPSATLMAGLYACSPKQVGYRVTFAALQVDLI
ncbi:MAG TPA: DUF1349 domain-containing protein [Tepidisphaeraceae bacterium]